MLEGLLHWFESTSNPQNSLIFSLFVVAVASYTVFNIPYLILLFHPIPFFQKYKIQPVSLLFIFYIHSCSFFAIISISSCYLSSSPLILSLLYSYLFFFLHLCMPFLSLVYLFYISMFLLIINRI